MTRRKQPAPEPVAVPREPWEARAYREAEELIRKVWELRGRPRIGGSFGCGPIGQHFYCESCRAEWPCATFALVADFGTASASSKGYKPLRLEPAESVAEAVSPVVEPF